MKKFSSTPNSPERVECAFPERTDLIGIFLQTFCALVFSSYFFFWPAGSLFLFTLVYFGYLSLTSAAILSALYFLNLVTSKVHKHNGWPAASRWFMYGTLLCDYVLHYYDGCWIREGPELDPKKQYLFAHWPHGIFGVCRAFSGGSGWNKMFPGISARWGSFGGAFYLPGVREFSLLATCIDASKPVLTRAVQEYGNNVMLLPGGIKEMNLTDRTNVTKLVGKDRMGYAKLAIELGLDIVPGFCFGEKWVHRKVAPPKGIAEWLNRYLKISLTLPKGRGLSFLGYKGKPLSFVHGVPIRVQQQNPVKQEYLEEVHGQVMAAIEDIFARYKSRFGYVNEEVLEWVESSNKKKNKKKRQ